MTHHTIIRRLRILAPAALLLLASISPILLPQAASAAQLTDRALTLQRDTVNSGTDEGSLAGGTVAHRFTYDTPVGGAFQSVKFLYCTTADVGETNCTTPVGLDTTSADLQAESGFTGGTLNVGTNGAPYVFYGSPQNNGSTVATALTLGDVDNPTDENTSFYVRILAYSNNDGTGTIVNAGTVAASTTTAIQLSGVMPESLVFCAGATIGKTVGVPDCSTVTTGVVNFNQLFSPTDTAYATSQMAASTNAGSGYAISVNGPTLTSGSYTIPAMAAAAQSAFGIGQFGINLVANDTVGAGYANAPEIVAYDTYVGSADIDLTSNGTNLKGQPTADYATNGEFKFAPGGAETIADSGNGGLGPTDAQIYTVSYIANVPGSQAPGTYTSTLLYIATPTF